MWQPGETTGMKASDHIKAILRHARRPVIDYAVINTAPISIPTRRRYARQMAMPVETDVEAIRKLGIKVVGFPLLSEAKKARHDSDKTAQVVLELAKKARRRRHI